MEANFQPVSVATSGDSNGTILVVRGGKMITIANGAKSEAELEAGTEVVGTFEGSTPNKFDPNKLDYSLRGEDGTLIILAQTASLAQQLSKVSEGDLVKVVYNGRKNITRKNGAKASMHDFRVFRATDAE